VRRSQVVKRTPWYWSRWTWKHFEVLFRIDTAQRSMITNLVAFLYLLWTFQTRVISLMEVRHVKCRYLLVSCTYPLQLNGDLLDWQLNEVSEPLLDRKSPSLGGVDLLVGWYSRVRETAHILCTHLPFHALSVILYKHSVSNHLNSTARKYELST